MWLDLPVPNPMNMYNYLPPKESREAIENEINHKKLKQYIALNTNSKEKMCSVEAKKVNNHANKVHEIVNCYSFGVAQVLSY